MSSRQPPADCLVDGCEDPQIKKSLYCERHSHDWIAAAEVPVEHTRVAGAVRRAQVDLREGLLVKVLDVYCAACRRTFEQARLVPCDAYSSVLRGGPVGTRKKKLDDEDADLAV